MPRWVNRQLREFVLILFFCDGAMEIAAWKLGTGTYFPNMLIIAGVASK